MRKQLLQKLDAGIRAAEQTNVTIKQIQLHPDTLERFWNKMLTMARHCEVRIKKVQGRYKNIPVKPNPRIPENRPSFIFPADADLTEWDETIDEWTKAGRA